MFRCWNVIFLGCFLLSLLISSANAASGRHHARGLKRRTVEQTAITNCAAAITTQGGNGTFVCYGTEYVDSIAGTIGGRVIVMFKQDNAQYPNAISLQVSWPVIPVITSPAFSVPLVALTFEPLLLQDFYFNQQTTSTSTPSISATDLTVTLITISLTLPKSQAAFGVYTQDSSSGFLPQTLSSRRKRLQVRSPQAEQTERAARPRSTTVDLPESTQTSSTVLTIDVNTVRLVRGASTLVQPSYYDTVSSPIASSSRPEQTPLQSVSATALEEHASVKSAGWHVGNGRDMHLSPIGLIVVAICLALAVLVVAGCTVMRVWDRTVFRAMKAREAEKVQLGEKQMAEKHNSA